MALEVRPADQAARWAHVPTTSGRGEADPPRTFPPFRGE